MLLPLNQLLLSLLDIILAFSYVSLNAVDLLSLGKDQSR